MLETGNHSAHDQLARNGVKAITAQRIMSRRMAREMSTKSRETALQASSWPTNPSHCTCHFVSGLDGRTLIPYPCEDDCSWDI
jgi:hypothetical protein